MGKGKRKDDKSTDLTTQEKFSRRMEEIRIKQKEAETKAKAAVAGFEHIDLVGFPISPEALTLIPKAQAEKEKVVSFLFTGSEVRIGAVDPGREEIKEIAYQIGERSHARVGVYMISEHSFENALKIYDKLPEIRTIVKGIQITDADLAGFRSQMPTLQDLNGLVQKVNATDFVALAVAAGLQFGSSDIHIEAEEKDVRVRLRIDGVLNTAASVRKDQWPRIVNRFKLISGLKINITTVPQDGRFTIFLGDGEQVDVRVSTIPTAYGESIVMRLLKSTSIGLGFEDMGLRGKAYDDLKREVERPNGMIVTTGPTGSGKTTTLYAILNKLNDSETKIITLEDPIEYKMAGISQSQIDASKDYTFAKGLKSILRQDPDIVMVGEIRELETAEVAIQAALTGHLMVSTIHTNSAAGAIPRFLSMGVKPFLLAPALNAIIGQRLVRRICENCRVEDRLDDATYARVRNSLSKLKPDSGYRVDLDNMKFWKGQGCEKCHGIGLKGRVGIYEVVAMTPAIENLILSGQVSEYQMEDIAREQGTIMMGQDGLLKALDGLTTVEEVLKVAEV